jgi:hypothetical protein
MSARQLGRENPELSNLGNTSAYLGLYILISLGQVRVRKPGKTNEYKESENVGHE